MGENAIIKEKSPVEISARKEFDHVAAKRFKELRQLNRYSQASIADALGLSCQQIQKYENGINRFSIGTLVLFCNKIGISLDDFCSVFKKQGFARPEKAQVRFTAADERILHLISQSGPSARDQEVFEKLAILNPIVKKKLFGLIRSL